MTERRKYHVTLSGGTLGAFQMSWATTVEAETPEAAEQAAREKCEREFDPAYAKGRAKVERVYTFAITLRGRRDARRRETFFIDATSERQAFSYLGHNPKATAFAGYVTRKNREELVAAVEQR